MVSFEGLVKCPGAGCTVLVERGKSCFEHRPKGKQQGKQPIRLRSFEL